MSERFEQERIDRLYRESKKTLINYRFLLLENDPEFEVAAADYHIEWSDMLLKETDNMAIQGFRESAKALPLSTEIPTSNGFKRIDNIQIGDYVFGKTGNKIKVIQKSKVFKNRLCYKIFFDDGTSIIADAEHLWQVYDKKKRKYKIYTTEFIYNNFGGWSHKNGYVERRYRIDLCQPVRYSKKNLKLDPYVLGVWLGDGNSDSPIFTIGGQDIKAIEGEFSKRGYSLNYLKCGKYMYSIKGQRHNFTAYNLLRNKHIPEVYKNASVTQRIDLVRGLIDSDGTLAIKGTKKGTLTFSNTNETLAKGFLEVVRSLGVKATIVKREAKLYGKFCGYCWNISFKSSITLSCLKRKENSLFPQYERSKRKTIISVNQVCSQDTQCITVEGDSLFLITRDYIITHNSQYVLRSFPLYCLTFPTRKRDYIVLLKNNATLAEKKLKEIEEEYKTNGLISANKVEIKEQSASVFSVDVKDSKGEIINIRIEAYGKGSSIRGLSNRERRPKVVICHAKDSLVLDNERFVKIQDSGFKKTKVDAECLEIRCHGVPYSEKVTTDHRYYVRSKKKSKNVWKVLNDKQFLEADKLTVNHYIGEPVDYTKSNVQPIKKYIPVIAERNPNGTVKKRKTKEESFIPEYFNDNEFWWVFGLWWGDGHITKDKVGWTCADKYPKISNRLKNFINEYGSSCRVERESKCHQLLWNNRSLSRWFKSWKYGNSIKTPPMWITQLDDIKLRNIICGYLDSDGWVDTKNKCCRITSINYEGLLFLRKMLSRLGIPSYIRKGAGPRFEKFPHGGISKSKQKYDILFSENTKQLGYDFSNRPRPKKINTVFIDKGFVWRKVRSINEAGECEVYPIKTDKSVYFTPNGLSHNCDDLQDRDEMRGMSVPEDDWRWFMSDVYFLGKSCRIFLIGNNLGEKCIIERILNSKEDLGYRTFRMPAIKTVKDPAHLNYYKEVSAWPTKFKLEDIYKQREIFRKQGLLDIWQEEKMCMSTSEETKTFKKDDRRYYTSTLAEKIRQNCNVVATLDPASSSEITAAFRAIVVKGIDKDNHWFVLDILYGRWQSDELINKMFEAVVKWHFQDFGIEKGMLKQIIEPFIYKEMSKRNQFFNIIPIEHAKAGSKLERVKMLAPRYKAHTIWHPETATWLAEFESELDGVTKNGFKSLFVDLIDAFSMHEQIGDAPMGNVEDQHLPRTAMSDNTDLKTIVNPGYQQGYRGLPRTAMTERTPI